jgi:acetyl-CoA synthetase
MSDTAAQAQGGQEGAGGYSEAQIAVHWREEEYYQPPEAIKSQANASDPEILERFAPENFPDSFVDYAELLTWDR